MGSNIAQTKHRVLKIDRTEPRDLVIIDDKVSCLQSSETSQHEMMFDIRFISFIFTLVEITF